MVIVTHNGKFHADDAWATAVLFVLFPDSELIRTRDPAVIERQRSQNAHLHDATVTPTRTSVKTADIWLIQPRWAPLRC